MNETLLTIKNLHVQYTSGGQIVRAVNGVDIELKKGETLGLVGETGAGKTTISKAILRILPDPPAKVTCGEVWLNDVNLFDLPAREMLEVRGNKIAMIFQDPMTALNPTMTVGNQIAEVILQHNDISNKEAMKRAASMLEMVGIPAMRYMEYPHQFSGGMKQRVVIAMALACNPELILADEPTTALDVTIQAQVLEMMINLKQKMNTSMILITHDLGVVAQTCDRVAVIYAGQIVESGTKEEIFNNPLHPYTIGLFGALPKLNDDSKRLSPILGLPPDPTNLPEGCSFNPRCPHAFEDCTVGQTPEMIEVTPGHFVRCILFRKESVHHGISRSQTS
ncbi:MAG TPA: ABC transporter ATP-binding protein [Clostridiales bacterium]|nr:ABC transporter ATP-binding protein [Clostridiales bacterium]